MCVYVCVCDYVCSYHWDLKGCHIYIHPLNTKLYLSDLKTQFVPRNKHTLLRFQNPVS